MSLNNKASRIAAILVPAAAIVIAVGFFMVPREKGAFAAALEHLRSTETIVCRVTISSNVRLQTDPGAEPSEVDPSRADGFSETQTTRRKLYLSAAHGVRRDTYQGDVLVSTTYSSDGGPTLTVYPTDRTYQTFDVDDEIKQAVAGALQSDINFASLSQNPSRLLRGIRALTSGADGDLGRDTFDGRELIGYAIAGEKVGFGPPVIDNAEENRAELWIDAQSGLAARLVFHFVNSIPGTRDLPLKASLTMTIVYDRFEWDTALSADWFEPVIPADYTRRQDGMPERMPMPDEAGLLDALRVFHELAGRYPSSLNALSIGQEVAYILGSLNAKRINAQKSGGSDAEIPDTQSVGEKLQGLALYSLLGMQGREPEYFGGQVKPGDAEAVLMKWQIEEGGTRVIYGDLRAETVSGEQTP